MRVGVDTGGTFTDVVALRRDGSLTTVKRLSTPRDPADAVLDGVRAAAGGAELSEVVHSTTVATNALLERRGGPTLLVTTRGFEDVLVLGRQARPQLYALHPVVAPPLIESAHRLGVDERLAADGTVLTALTDEKLDALRDRVRACIAASEASPAGAVKSIAICLLHAYANPAHEEAVAAALAPLGLPISRSSAIVPLPREYERTSTTVVDAYVRPVMAGYLARIGQELAPARLRIMQSNGGAISADEAALRPVRTLLSGPAAGVVGALEVARAAGVEDLLTLDMGGTSTDVALVAGGRLGEAEETWVAQYPLQLPMLAVHTVGAGGGSVAWLDAGSALKVGPQSAGAEPGPAAYGRGGVLPTVTDANLVLGRLDPAGFLGGELRLDADAARAALEALGAQLGKPAQAAAEDVIAVADAIVARALKRISVERGHDPARFTLVPFGGAGGLHACAVGRALGMTRVLIPPSPGLLCAYGALAADVVHDVVHTLLTDAGAQLDVAALAGELEPLQAQAERALDADDVPSARRVLETTCNLRYRGQSFELTVPAEGDLVRAFHEAHRARYGYALADRAVELVSVRLRAIGRAASLPPPREAAPPSTANNEAAAQLGRTTVIWQGRAYGAARYQRRALADGARVQGPALVLEYSATTFLPPDTEGEVLDGGALLLRV